MFEWKNDYNTGIAEIDQQHKTLFKIANNAYELLKNEFYTDKYDRIVEIIEELKNYTVFHFTAEEEYMMKIGYKKFFSHKVEHEEFIKKFNEINLNKIDADQDKYITELLEFVYNWIDHHILIVDRQYVLQQQ